MPSQEYLHNHFNYDPQSGELISLKNNCPVGTPHGKDYPYKVVRLNTKLRFVHRLIWVYVHGKIAPHKNIDHINGNPSDNRLINLRLVSQRDNIRNIKLRSNNTSGYHGVQWHKRCRKWQARIKTNNGSLYLGLFKDKKDAIAARQSAEKLNGYHDNHGKRKGGQLTPCTSLIPN